MHGSLALSNGVLWVARWARTLALRPYDLDGNRLAGGFDFRDDAVGASDASGLAVDDDRRLWVADRRGVRVRAFTVFGAETHRLASAERDDTPGAIVEPAGVAARGSADALALLVANGGERRHALQVFDESGGLVRSLRSEGDSHRLFSHLEGVALRGRFAYACEAGHGCVQVFRDLRFHARIVPPGPAPRPRSVAPLEDGRVLVACGGRASAVWLLDPSGRPLERLAGPGADDGEVFEPSGVVVEDSGADRDARVAVIDRDGDRVQVFALDGRCFGAVPDLQP